MRARQRTDSEVRFQESDRQNVNRIKDIKIADPQGRSIPLSQHALISIEQGPAQISRKSIQWRISVETNVRGPGHRIFCCRCSAGGRPEGGATAGLRNCMGWSSRLSGCRILT